MNLGVLKTHVANRVGNDAISAVLTEMVNQIQYDMCQRYHFSWRISLPVSLTTIANQNYLNPSAYLTNFGDPWDAVELTTPKKLFYLPVWNVNLLDADYAKTTPTRVGVPTHYSVDFANSRLWLYPTPNAAYSLRIRYLKDPPEISNTSSTLFIPSKYHYVVAAGVESLAWSMDTEQDNAKIANERYEAGIAKMIDEENNLPDYQPTFASPMQVVDYSDPFLEF